MKDTQLHKAISAVALNNPGMLISDEVLRNLALDAIIRASTFTSSAPVIFPSGHAKVVGRYKQLSIDPNSLTVSLDIAGSNPLLNIRPGFTLSFDLLDPKSQLVYSTVELDIQDIVFPLVGRNNKLIFDPIEMVLNAVVKESGDRAAAIASTKIDENDLLRVEGAVAFGASSKIVRTAFGEVSIVLEDIFPAFRFGGELKMHNVRGSLLIVPELFEFIGNTGCPKGDIGKDVRVIPQQPTLGPDGGQWPIFVQLPNTPKHTVPLQVDGLVAAYLPKTLLDVHFGKVAPAISYRDGDNGFIGYDVELTAALRDVVLSIDLNEMALRINLGFAMWGFANATVDVPCIGRVEIAQVHFTLPQKNGTSFLEILVRPGVDASGRLLMLSEIASASLGEAEVRIQLFSKYLGMAGGEKAVIGFLVDAVVGRILASILPGLVLEAVKSNIDNHFFVLADLSSKLKYFQGTPNGTTWSGTNDSVLLGIQSRGRHRTPKNP